MIWEPRGTHPGYSFLVDGVENPETRMYTCTLATLDGAALDNPQAVYQQVYAEHATLNRALHHLQSLLPPNMLKPILDDDGDPLYDENGAPVMVIKEKHTPLIGASPLGQATTIAIPGTAQNPGLDAQQVAAVSAALAAALQDDELVSFLQPITTYDLVKQVALVTA